MGHYSEALRARATAGAAGTAISSLAVTVDLTIVLQEGSVKVQRQLSPDEALAMGQHLIALATRAGGKPRAALCVQEASAGGPLDAHAYAVVLSTERPIAYTDYVRIWDHSPGAVHLSQPELPLQFMHDGRCTIGVVRGLRLEGRKLHGIAYFGDSAEAQEVRARVDCGELRAVSVTARELALERIEAGYRVTKWLPVEVSICDKGANPDCNIRPLSEVYA